MKKSFAHLLMSAAALSFLFIACGKDSFTKEEFNDNGQLVARYEIRVADSVRHGLYEGFYEDTKLYERAQYKDGQLEGKRSLYHPNGELQTEETYVNGQFIGTYKNYYEDGQLQSEGEYVDNEMTGLWKVYYPDGTLHKKLTFANNEENGPFITYYSNGMIKDQGRYVGGEFIDGEFKIYDSSGVHVRTMQYDNGRGRVTWTKEGVTFNQDGEIVKQ